MANDTQFDVEGARKAGYSDDEILGHLSQGSDFDVQGALKAGHSSGDIINYLSSKNQQPVSPEKQALANPPVEAPSGVSLPAGSRVQPAAKGKQAFDPSGFAFKSGMFGEPAYQSEKDLAGERAAKASQQPTPVSNAAGIIMPAAAGSRALTGAGLSLGGSLVGAPVGREVGKLGNAPETGQTVGSVIGSLAGMATSTPEVPPGLSEEATANLNTADVRAGVEKIFQAAGPSRTDTGFRETLSKAAPDIAQMSRETPLKAKGGVVNPDFRPREFVTNLSDYMNKLWESEYKPQVKHVANVEASLNDIKAAMQSTISQVDKEKNPGLVDSLQRELSTMPDKESVGNLENRRVQLSDKLNKYYKATPEQQVAMENQNFNLAATKAEYDAVLNTLDATLKANGQAGGMGPRGRYGNLAEVRNYVAKQMNPAEEARLSERLSQIFFRRGAERLATGTLVNPSVGRQLQSGTRLLGRSSLFPPETPPIREALPMERRLPETAGPPGLIPSERLGENISGGPAVFEPQTGKYHDILAPVSSLETSESSQLGREKIQTPWGEQTIDYSKLPRDVQPRIDDALRVLRDPAASGFDKARAKGFLSDIGVDTSKEQPVGKRIVRGPR